MQKVVQCLFSGFIIRWTSYLKLHGLSPRANYTDRATAACRRSDLPTCADRMCHVVSVTDPSGRISRFSRQEPLLFYQVALQFVLTRLSAPRYIYIYINIF
jgi:hypothetical protein